MKRYLFVLLSALFVFGACSEQKTHKQASNEKNKAQQMLVGKVKRSDFLQEPYKDWFEKGYNDYQVDSLTLDSINNKDFTMTIVMGTWCPDSRREVPRMLKILDKMQIPDSNVSIICVDHDKKAGKENISSLNIQRIPTFIVYINGKEKGRIVEHPKKNLERDLMDILNDGED